MNVLRRRSADDHKPWPPGIRFHPTDEELVLYYLKRKICGRKIKLDIVRDIDVYKWDPKELPGQSKLKTGDRQWFFFSPRDRKYPNGARSNRATRHGYWKATGKDRTVKCNSRNVGVKKTLVFHRGRAPRGERTNWVMHEYTMNEEELSRCTNVQSYYAVYKVFEKSGLGPKNGEQYGAPFNEEDWVDDEFCDFNNSDDQEIPAEKPKTDTAAIERGTCPASPFSLDFSLDDLDMLMKQISDESLFEFPEADPCANSLPQVGGQEESVSTVDLPSQEHALPRSVEVSNSEQQPSNAAEGFDLIQSDISRLQPFQTPETKSAPKISELASFLFDDDFLEIDDLGGPKFNRSNQEKPSGSGSLQFEESVSTFDRRSQEHVLPRSVEVFNSEPRPSNAAESFNLIQSHISQLQPFQTPETKSAPKISELPSFLFDDDFLEIDDLGGPEFNRSNQEKPSGSGSLQFEELKGLYKLDEFHDVVMFLNDSWPFEYGTVPNLYENGNVNNVANPLDGQFQSNSDCANASQIDNPMPMPDPAINGSALSELQRTSGVLCESSNFVAETNQTQVGEDGSSASRVSSALWAFVESLPTTPASAAENGLVNLSFDQISSFGRTSTTVSTIDSSLMSRRTTSRSRKGGFFLFSVLGALCAILWVFIGAVRLWKRCISL